MTLALTNWRLDGIDWLALGVIIWLVVAVVVAPFIGQRLKARRRRDSRPVRDDERPLGYRPPRD